MVRARGSMRPPSALVGVRHVPPAPRARDPGPDLIRPVPRAAAGRVTARAPAGALAERRRPRARPPPGPSPDAAGHAQVGAGGAPDGARRRGRPGRPPRRRRSARRCAAVHMFSEQPQPTTRSAPRISSAASGVAQPPLTSSSTGGDGTAPWRRPTWPAARRMRRPAAPARPPPPARPPAPRRPATNTGRCAAEAAGPAPPPAGPRRDPQPGRAGPRPAPCWRSRPRPGALARLHVQRHGQDHAPPLPLRRPVRADHVVDGEAGRVQPGRRRADARADRGDIDPKLECFAAWLTSAARTSSGVRLLAASVSAVRALVMPGPWCRDSTPGRPPIRRSRRPCSLPRTRAGPRRTACPARSACS